MWATLTKDEVLEKHDGIPTLAELQEAAGGDVEVVNVQLYDYRRGERILGDEATIWLNETGKYPLFDGEATRGELENVKATHLWVKYSPYPVRSGEFIAGNVAFTGPPDRNGDTMTLSDEWIEKIRHAVENLVIFRIGG